MRKNIGGTPLQGDNISVECIDKGVTSEDRWGAKYFMRKQYRKKSAGDAKPKHVMLRERHVLGHKFAVTYEESSKNRWFASYLTKQEFLNQLKNITKTNRRFSEVLWGPVHTFADLDWKTDEFSASEAEVMELFERVFREAFNEFVDGGVLDTDVILWSSASSDKECKGSLHFQMSRSGCFLEESAYNYC